MTTDIVLYNVKGKPVAFIQLGFDSIVYLMNGQAVAYLEHIGCERARIWGLNGKHMGWYDDDGIVYNSEAMRIGFNRDKYNREFDRPDAPKHKRRRSPILLPVFALENSDEDLQVFLKQGI